MLEQELKKFLKDHKLVIFLCIGNVMRGDDAIGPILARKLKVIFKNQKDFIIINAETVPENYTGLIRKEEPSHIIFIDAVEMDMNPGEIKLIESNEIANYSISTHAMPISFMIKYIESFTDAKILLIGVQPKNIDLSNQVSDEVKNGVEELSRILKNNFNV
ncbi:hydrogenase maturation peptidase HycI [Methanobacterium sp. SMA-27]|uniref:hydrogenase maturation peptidase HycI n=1 Tax=Methanobacterium sp. SMA-27 TaxID=1495336 RepID=UPI00064FC85A|nr:hydrogenase maturation peptidase HycI [Methanobacterium sp. SMA-27]